MFATKKLITGLNDDPCFLTILIKIDLATLYVDSDLESWKISTHYLPPLFLFLICILIFLVFIANSNFGEQSLPALNTACAEQF